MSRAGMDCKEFVDFIMSYIESELPENQAAVFEQHLRDCPPCEVYLDTYRETIQLGREACRGDALPEEAPEELVNAILAARAKA